MKTQNHRQAVELVVQERTAQIDSLRKEYEGLREAVSMLVAKPHDPNANLALGRFQCFSKGHWDKGLPLLALGSDAALAAQAKKDLANPLEPAAQTELGEGWWEQAQKETGRSQIRIQERARFWFRQAFPRLTGPAKDQVEKRLSFGMGSHDLKPGLVAEFFQGANFQKKAKTRMALPESITLGGETT